MLTLDQLITIIEKTIMGQRHEWYDYTVKMSELCYSMMTGENQKEILETFRSRETTKQMEQRERLFQSPTRGFLAPIENMYEKIRFLDSEAIKKIDELPSPQGDMLSRFMGNAWENQTLDSYLYDICRYYNFYDPNAVVVIEESRIRGQENEVVDINVYPIEATSKEIVNYQLKQGKVEWIVVEFMAKEELVSKPGKFVDISKFYMYAPGYAVEYIQYHETPPDGAQYLKEIKVGSKVLKFSVSVFETTTVETPAMRVGAYLDPKTRNETFIPPYWAALLKLNEAIRDKSMQDVNIPGHVYPKEYALAPRCDYFDEGINIRCDNGYIGDHKCPKCHGTGHNLHISEQDRIVLALPDEGLELPDLSKLIYWHTPPEWLPTYMDARLKELEKSVFWLTFNTQMVETPLATETATGRNMDYEAIQQKLTPYAKAISDCWRKYVRVSVQYLERWTPDFIVDHSFPKDHKLQSAAELMDEFKQAKQMGLAYPILERIEDKILSKQRVDNPQEVAMYRAFRAHLPFKDKSESTAARIVYERDREDFDRLLWENSDKVYTTIKDRYFTFAGMQMSVQRTVIETILNEIKGQIIYQQELDVTGANFN